MELDNVRAAKGVGTQVTYKSAIYRCICLRFFTTNGGSAWVGLFYCINSYLDDPQKYMNYQREAY
jgi:hypothetical protein